MSTGITLYDLAEEFRSAAEALRDSELDEQTITDTLEGLQFPVEVKARNVAIVIANMRAEADAIREAKERLAAREKRIDARMEWLESYLLANMQRCEIKKIESPIITISLRNNPPKVIIDDEKILPWEFMKQPPQPPPTPEKTLIRDALKAGKFIPGAHLEQSQRVEIKI